MAGNSTRHLGPDRRNIPDHLAHHRTHGGGDAVIGGRADPTNKLGRDGAPKHVANTGIHDGMHSRIAGDARGLLRVGGGHMRSALQDGGVIGPNPIHTIDKTLPKPAAHKVAEAVIGQRSRTQSGETGPGEVFAGVSTNHINAKKHDPQIGKRIFKDAILAGSTTLRSK